MCSKVEVRMKAQVAVLGWVFTTLCLVSYTAAFSHGASLVACLDMKPKHIRAQLQSPRNSYIIIHSNMSSFSPGDKVPVTVRSSRDFMGFLLQARRVSNDEVTGTFVFVPSGSKLMNCFKEGDTVTHSDKSLKRNLSFVWKAPDQSTGDIKFFLSVVQSYFVYWARIESVVVSQQTQNRTLSDRSEEPGPDMPTMLQKPYDLKIIPSEDRAPSSSILLTHPVEFIPTSLTRTAATGWEHILTGDGNREIPGDGPNPLGPSLSGVTSQSSDGGEQPGWRSSTDTDEMLEPSLEAWHLEGAYALGSFGFEENSSSHHSLDRYWANSEVLPLQFFPFHFRARSSPTSPGTPRSCLNCEQNVQAIPGTSSLALTRAPLPTEILFPAHLLGPQRLSATEAVPRRLNGKANSIILGNAPTASPQMATRESAIPKASANFLSQSAKGGEEEEQEEEGQEGKEDDKREDSGYTSPWMTKPMPGTANPRQDGRGSHWETQIMAAQLSILLCLSATFGMALAAVLRCLHDQYCHKRTEVSFSEPDSDIPTGTDSEEVMHVKKIRENSFVLVQAEYNWITPSAGMKKTLV
ncbi:reelin domain-containing protein 1 [Ornithorhynchus anatinus]|uniref:reelin domain-containing protein 1 n=1 Tax=Ornithorhynchus anatinus TaxID=9258 RepID=UPI0019D42397|nr:reelin domain-containing protein 1 [Ornithorhynchus anatinus]